MRHRTAEETHHQNRRVLCVAGSERVLAPAGGGLSAGDLGASADYRNHRHRRGHWLAGLQTLSRFGTMVVAAIKRSGLMGKRQIEYKNICWLEVSWQRPFTVEGVFGALTHLSSLSPRGAVIWECREGTGVSLIYWEPTGVISGKSLRRSAPTGTSSFGRYMVVAGQPSGRHENSKSPNRCCHSTPTLRSRQSGRGWRQ